MWKTLVALAWQLAIPAQELFLAKPKPASASGFLSYADLVGAPYNVSYDKRSLLVNGERSLFLSGSVHPPRGTQAMWETWFAQAVENGLNMVQVYVFWNYHYPVEGQGYWTGSGDLVKFVQRAAAHGLFVNLRVGPYVCAEWTYGGIPHWLGLKDGVKFRQTNDVWQAAMEDFFAEVIDKMSKVKLFATQGGPIVLVQVENELQPTDEAYIQWSGDMANRVLAEKGAAGIPVEMCNGEAANNTINTCNSKDCLDFLEKNGQSGRILVDQPALWTENEGGFQVWGGAPPPGTENYFWGRATAELAMSILRWIARGGSHMNYYMWTGGNNYGRWHGASITTMYAVDAQVCPDGLPHEPKFSHTTAMHAALKKHAAEILRYPAQLRQQVALEWYNPTSQTWAAGSQQVAFIYGDTAFVESSASVEVLTRVNGVNVTMPPASVSILDMKSGLVSFNSASVQPSLRHRSVQKRPVFQRWSWKAWQEPFLEAETSALPRQESDAPMEQGALSRGLTVYAYYERNVTLNGSRVTLSIASQKSTAFVVFVGGRLVGQAENHNHGHGAQSLSIDIDGMKFAPGKHLLTILSEDLGFSNYGFKERLTKGIDGTVQLGNQDITRGGWRMRSGLAGEYAEVMNAEGAERVHWSSRLPAAETPLVWYRSSFDLIHVPEGSSLLLNATGLGRGRFFINGHDSGRYWTLARNGPFQGRPTQQLYHIPSDWLRGNGNNVLTILEVSGASDLKSPSLVLAQVQQGPGPEVDPTKISECKF